MILSSDTKSINITGNIIHIDSTKHVMIILIKYQDDEIFDILKNDSVTLSMGDHNFSSAFTHYRAAREDVNYNGFYETLHKDQIILELYGINFKKENRQ